MKHDKTKEENRTQTPRRTLTLDVEKYQSMLDAPGTTAKQRDEFLKATWNVVVAFVDLGFEIRSEGHCGQVGSSQDESTLRVEDLIELTQLNLGKEFEISACASASGKE